eukprot:scaffold679_cov374-Prasinococcus_capsulatus_cf.AAC.12
MEELRLSRTHQQFVQLLLQLLRSLLPLRPAGAATQVNQTSTAKLDLTSLHASKYPRTHASARLHAKGHGRIEALCSVVTYCLGERRSPSEGAAQACWPCSVEACLLELARASSRWRSRGCQHSDLKPHLRHIRSMCDCNASAATARHSINERQQSQHSSRQGAAASAAGAPALATSRTAYNTALASGLQAARRLASTTSATKRQSGPVQAASRAYEGRRTCVCACVSSCSARAARAEGERHSGVERNSVRSFFSPWFTSTYLASSASGGGGVHFVPARQQRQGSELCQHWRSCGLAVVSAIHASPRLHALRELRSYGLVGAASAGGVVVCGRSGGVALVFAVAVVVAVGVKFALRHHVQAQLILKFLAHGNEHVVNVQLLQA